MARKTYVSNIDSDFVRFMEAEQEFARDPRNNYLI